MVFRRDSSLVAFGGRTVGWLIILMCMILSACSAGGALPIPPGAPETEAETFVFATDGERLATSEWGPEAPRGVILGFHGFGDYGDLTFRRAAEYWQEQGLIVIAVDQRGFGRNRSKGYWPGAEALISDAITVSRQVRERFPELTLTVIGHSMGGGVVAAAAASGLEADRIVLAAPAIWGGSQLNPIYRVTAWFAATVVPDRRFTGEGVVRIQASDNIEALRELARDPNYLSPPSARELHGLVRLTDLAEAAAPDVRIPSLMLLGTKDQVAINTVAERTFGLFPAESHVVEYPEGWHLLFRDLQAERVWHDVAAWALDGEPPGPEGGSS